MPRPSEPSAAGSDPLLDPLLLLAEGFRPRRAVFFSFGHDEEMGGPAGAVVTFRILPGESIESVLEHVRRTVADERVPVSALAKRREPSPTSRTRSQHFALLSRTIREVFPAAIVALYLMLGGSDARHYFLSSKDVYRFMPFLLSERDLEGIHGTNERVSTEALTRAVGFYARLLSNAAGTLSANEPSLGAPTAVVE